MRPLTRSCLVLLPIWRLFLLALFLFLGTCLLSLWNPPIPLHAPTLIYLSLAKVRLSLTWTLFHLMILCSGQTGLFLFLLAKAALAYLPTAVFMALRPPFRFRQAQYVPVFPLKPAPFCKLFAVSATPTSLLPLFSFRTLALSSPLYPLLRLSFYLNLCGRSVFVSSCSIRLQWVPGHSFLPGNDPADELARRGGILAPSAIPCGLSPLINSSLFSDWRRTVSSKFF